MSDERNTPAGPNPQGGDTQEEPAPEKSSMSRRDALKKGAYAAPAIMTIGSVPAFASSGSPCPGNSEKAPHNSGGECPGNSGDKGNSGKWNSGGGNRGNGRSGTHDTKYGAEGYGSSTYGSRDYGSSDYGRSENESSN